MSQRPADTRRHSQRGLTKKDKNAGRQKTDAIREEDGGRGEKIVSLCFV